MSLQLNAVQVGVYDLLVGDATLMSLVTGVFDDVPPGTAYPYVTLGEHFGTPWETKSSLGFDEVVPIHVWSKALGWKEVNSILERIYEVLHNATFTVTGKTVLMLRYTNHQALRDRDADGELLRHGVAQYRIIVTE